MSREEEGEREGDEGEHCKLSDGWVIMASPRSSCCCVIVGRFRSMGGLWPSKELCVILGAAGEVASLKSMKIGYTIVYNRKSIYICTLENMW